MKHTLQQIEHHFSQLDDRQEELGEAFQEIGSAISSLEETGIQDEVHCILAGVAKDLESGESSTEKPSSLLHSLREKVRTEMDEHPGIVLEIGRIADAFASLGL